MRANVNKKKRKKGRIIFNILIFFLFLTVLGMGIFSHFFLNILILIGEWDRNIDVTDIVKDKIFTYIGSSNIPEGFNLDEYVPKIEIKSRLTITGDGRFEEKIDDSSYYDAQRKAAGALSKAVIEVLNNKIDEVYINTDVSTEELIGQATGMKMNDYLNKYGPDLLPELSLLNEESSISAEYLADRSTIFITVQGKELECEYAIADNMLAIDYEDGARIYYSAKDRERKANEEEAP